MARTTSGRRASGTAKAASRRVTAPTAGAAARATSAPAGTGTLVVRLLDVQGRPIGEPVTASLRHMTRGTVSRLSLDGAGDAEVPGLLAQPDGLYRVQAIPPSYRPTGGFVEVLRAVRPAWS